jgi:hypothetical protein
MTDAVREPSDDDVLRNLLHGHRAQQPDDEDQALAAAVQRVLHETTPAEAVQEQEVLQDERMLRNLQDVPHDVAEDLAQERIRRALIEGSPTQRRRPPAPRRRPPARMPRPTTLPRALVVPEPTPMEAALLEHTDAWDRERALWRVSLTPAAAAWTAEGFTPDQARAWRSAGCRLDEAVIAATLRDFGFTPNLAAGGCCIDGISYGNAPEAARARGVSIESIVQAYAD